MIIWRYRIAKHNYLEKIAERENTARNKQLNTYRIKNGELTEQNEKMAKIIHKNYKIIPALIFAVKQLKSGENADEVMARLDDNLAEYDKFFAQYGGKEVQFPQTGIPSLDGVMGYLLTYAQSCGVDLGFDINHKAVALCACAIKHIADLNTIVCDLCENAVHAVKSVIDPAVCAVFDISEAGLARFCVYDNGAPFDEKVIANLGKKRYTTRKAEGGSGIGLFTVIEILKNCNATFTIVDNPDREGFTKCVVVSFGGADKK